MIFGSVTDDFVKWVSASRPSTSKPINILIVLEENINPRPCRTEP